MKCEAETERICKFIKDTVEDAGAKGVVLGLSGGIDSAVVLALCVKTLGLNGVRTYHFYKDTDTYAKLVKLTPKYHMFCEVYYTFNLDEMHYARKRHPNIKKNNRLAYGNLKSRLIMSNLRLNCELNNALLVGTTNKSEHLIGYFTKYGDGGSDFEPIQHLYKTDVYKLAEYLKVPKKIIDAKPSADLWEGQTDEGEIGMSYEKLDEILKHLKPEHCWFNEWYSVESCQERTGFKREDIIKVKEMIKKSEHKRRLPKCLRSVTNAGK